MTNARVVSGAPLWRRAFQVLAQGWSRTGKAIQSLWRWTFPPVPPALRSLILRGLTSDRVLITYLALIFIGLIPSSLILTFHPEPPDHPFLGRLWASGANPFTLPALYWLREIIQAYLKYRRMARWMQFTIYDRRYEVPRALALRSAFLVPAILDYFHEHFNSSEGMMSRLLGRRRLMGGSRFIWQEVLLSPSSGRVYTLPRSWWQRLLENWNRLLWKVTRRDLHSLYKSFPEFEGKRVRKSWFRKILALDKKTIIDSVVVFLFSVLFLGLLVLLTIGIVLLVVWLSRLLNIDITWLSIFIGLLSILVMIAPYIHIKRGPFSDLRINTYLNIVLKQYPMEKPLSSFFSSEKDEDSELETGPDRKEAVSEIRAETSSREESVSEIQAETSPGEESISEIRAETSSGEEENDTAQSESATSAEEEQKTQKEPSDPEESNEFGRFMEALNRFLTETLGRGMITAFLMARGHEFGMDRDPIWAHSLGMGFLWDLPSDAATLRRYKALPEEAKGMIDAILQEVLRRFNDPLSKYTAMAYPEIKEKCTYAYLPHGKTLIKIHHTEEMSFEFVHEEALPERSDYFLNEEVPGYLLSSGEEKDEKPEILIVGWDRGYTLGDYARLFRSSVEMKSSFWAAYQAAWRLMRMVSEARDDAEYFGEPLVLPVRGAEGYVRVKGVRGFRVVEELF